MEPKVIDDPFIRDQSLKALESLQPTPILYGYYQTHADAVNTDF
jgi:hypothetical protein